MRIFGVDVNPYELFLILILLLATTGSFSTSAARTGKNDPRAHDSPVGLLSSKRRAPEKS